MKKSFIFISKNDAVIGNLSEQLYYALYKAWRLSKKVRFIRKHIFFDKLLKRKTKYAQLTGIYRLRSPLIIPKNLFFHWIVGLYAGFVFWGSFFSRVFLYKIGVISSFQIKLFGIGHQDLFNINQRDVFVAEDLIETNWKKFLSMKQSLYFNDKDEKECRKRLVALGVKKGRWYVCLHIRTDNFHGSNQPHRNAKIENYLEAISYIREQGGAVIRMGDPIHLGHQDCYIDYPNTQHKSELMDLFLIKNCKFLIGTNSGIMDTAFLFTTPMLAVNVTDFLYAKPYKANDLFIYKHVFSKKEKRILAFNEVFQQSIQVNYAINVGFLKRFLEAFDFIENTSIDIKNATVEMFENLQTLSEETSFQKEFKNILNKATLCWAQDESFLHNDLDEVYRIISKTYFNGRIGRDFSEKYLKSVNV